MKTALNPYMLSVGKELEKLRATPMSKAATGVLSTTDLNVGGALSVEEADTFFTEVVDESKFLQMCNVHRTNKAQGRFTHSRITGHITSKATEGTDSGIKKKPVYRKTEYTTKKARSAVDITGEVNEDSVAGGNAQTLIMNDITVALGNDLETLAWMGDENVVGSDEYSQLVQTNDGWLKQMSLANGAHVISANNKRASYDLLSQMFRNMPSKWKKNLSELRWLMSWGAYQSLVDLSRDRATVFGDGVLQDGNFPKYYGIQIEVLPLLPDDIELTGTQSLGTEIVLTKPKNLTVVLQREVSIEWERKPRSDVWEGTIYTRTDYIVEIPDMCVRCVDVAVDPAVTRY